MSNEIEYALYGDYVICGADEISSCKELLLEQMICAIRELAKQNDFWIVKKPEDFITTLKPHPALKENQVTVAWKIHFPQMDKYPSSDKGLEAPAGGEQKGESGGYVFKVSQVYDEKTGKRNAV